MSHHTIVHLCLCPRHGYHMVCLHHSPPLHISCPSRPPLLLSHYHLSWATSINGCLAFHQQSSMSLACTVAAHSPAASMACICSFSFDFIAIAYVSPKEKKWQVWTLNLVSYSSKGHRCSLLEDCVMACLHITHWCIHLFFYSYPFQLFMNFIK